jgi:hypothetical protein
LANPSTELRHVEKLQAELQARNNGIGIVRRVILYCLCGWLDESLLR